jgi:hypothetical protein
MMNQPIDDMNSTTSLKIRLGYSSPPRCAGRCSPPQPNRDAACWMNLLTSMSAFDISVTHYESGDSFGTQERGEKAMCAGWYCDLSNAKFFGFCRTGRSSWSSLDASRAENVWVKRSGCSAVYKRLRTTEECRLTILGETGDDIID